MKDLQAELRKYWPKSEQIYWHEGLETYAVTFPSGQDRVVNLTYSIHGMPSQSGLLWLRKKKTRVHASFEFEVISKVTESPEGLKGKSVRLLINYAGSEDYQNFSSRGLLGFGWMDERQLLIQARVRPDISENIFQFIFAAAGPNLRRKLISCDFVNPRFPKNKSKESEIWFDLLALRCSA